MLNQNRRSLSQFLRLKGVDKRSCKYLKYLLQSAIAAFILLTIIIGLSACDQGKPTQELASYPHGRQCVSQFDPEFDYFPHKAVVKYAQGFGVTYHKHYKLVTINPPFRGAKSAVRYLLIQCGTPIPQDVSADQIVELPVRSQIVLSTTHIPHLERLKVLDRLVGIADLALVYSADVRERVAQHKIKEIAKGGQLNTEEVIRLNPDLITTFAIGNSTVDTYPKLTELGLKVVLNAEYLENSPLGRAEWLKFTALFFNQEELADQEFNKIEAKYKAIATLAQNVKQRPTVITGLNFQGTWHVAGGNSYTAKFLQDAGANYLWSDNNQTGAIPLSFEAVFAKGSNADFWLPNASMWLSLADITNSDPRYAEFLAFRNRQIFNNTHRRRADGANDFWESGTLNPDLILADLVKIFHPALLPNHNLFYFQRLN